MTSKLPAKRRHSSGNSQSSSKRSNTPSANSSIRNGKDVAKQRLRSVISHPLGLPLGKALHRQDPERLAFLSRPCHIIENDSNLDNILSPSIADWKKEETLLEPKLTELIAANITKTAIKTGISCENEVNVVSSTDTQGRMDVLLSRDSDNNEPLAVIEVGLDHSKWWKKFDQGFQYVKMVLESRRHEQGQEQGQGEDQKEKQPVLLAVLTVETNKATAACRCKLGVFLCVQSSNCSYTHSDADYRIILLRFTIARNLAQASSTFGQFLRTTIWFSHWLMADPAEADEYHYLSSNCCLVRKRKKTEPYYVSLIEVSDGLFFVPAQRNWIAFPKFCFVFSSSCLSIDTALL